MTRRLALAAAVLLPAAAVAAGAQQMPPMAGMGGQQAPASPPGTARGTVGSATVTVNYSRPSKRGRTIFAANGLAPFGKVWRTGANAATTLVTTGDLQIGGTRVPAGTYTLYTIPDSAAWQLVISRQTGQWGTEYHQDRDLARVPMTVTRLSAPVEQFTIAVEPGALVMRWDDTQASAPLRAAGR